MEWLHGIDIEQMKERWADRTPGSIDRMKVRHFAVLLPLIERDGELQVLFEVRAASLRRQPGEVCFPGGAVEVGETYQQTAVRETVEELLIREEQMEILAPLDILETPGGVNVYPYLGVIRDYENTFSKDEVEYVFSVPLSWFATHGPERYEATVHTVPNENFPFDRIPGGREYYWKKGRYDVLFYPKYREDETHVIWGMTAKILEAFVRLYREAFDI